MTPEEVMHFAEKHGAKMVTLNSSTYRASGSILASLCMN